MEELISVIMGIYNCQDTLAEAIESVISQTYTKWEIIMCDDCSCDKTLEIAKKYGDIYPNKIKILKNDKNMGLNYTLNKCLKNSRGKYIARMDGDDICSPNRFNKEINLLIKNPEISIVSTDMYFFDENGIWGQTQAKEEPNKFDFLRKTPFCHAACMVKKEAYDEVGGYSVGERLLRVEDYHLWAKMYEKGYKGMNIKEPLYMMRDDRDAQSRKKFRYRINEAYVKAYAVKHLNLPIWGYIYCIKPILIGLLPSNIYRILHRKK